MNTLEIPEKDIFVEIPSHWDEMTDVQRRYCVKQAVWASLGVISPIEAKIRCLYHLLEMERDWKAVAKDRIWDEHHVHDKYSRIYLLCEELITFLFSVDEKGQLEISYDTIYNHFPELRAGKVILYGPGHLCADLTFGEFRAALEYMNEYFETGEEFTLCKMLACLYRPKRLNYAELIETEDFDGQKREPFNRARIEINARHIQSISTIFRTVVLLWFSYCIKYVQTEDLMIGGGTVNFSDLFPKSKKEEGEVQRRSVSDWIYLLHGVAKDGPFGDIDKTDKTNWFDILIYLEDTKRQNDKLKAKTKRR